MRCLLVGAARPNFMKVAPVLRALEARSVKVTLVHTGQHYDHAMAASFFEDLGIRSPDVDLAAGAGTQGRVPGAVMPGFEPFLDAPPPGAVIAAGDVTSTVGCARVPAKAGVPLAHVEAALRPFARLMPEEINRLCTD